MKEISLRNKELELEFLFGYCSFSYRNLILTKKMGLYSSIYHENRWYDSKFANWEVLESDKFHLKLYGEWINLPHRQTWNLKLEEYKLHWEIICENLNEFVIEMIQQNFMLTDGYSNWEVENYAEGKFPEYFQGYGGLLWDRIWSMPQVEGTKITLWGEQEKVPKFHWISPVSSPNCLVSIENSDPNFYARIVQVMFINPVKESLDQRFITLSSIIYLEE